MSISTEEDTETLYGVIEHDDLDRLMEETEVGHVGSELFEASSDAIFSESFYKEGPVAFRPEINAWLDEEDNVLEYNATVYGVRRDQIESREDWEDERTIVLEVSGRKNFVNNSEAEVFLQDYNLVEGGYRKLEHLEEDHPAVKRRNSFKQIGHLA